MKDTDCKRIFDELEKEWDLLMPGEKALMLSYRRSLQKGLKISSSLIIAINLIHEKYPDFHIGLIPKEKEIEFSPGVAL
jgi:hypothetical protein